VTAFTERALDFFLDRVVVAERLMTDNAFAYTQNRSLRDCCTPARSAASARGLTRPGPTARSSGSSAGDRAVNP
jgi:hypothetical protein